MGRRFEFEVSESEKELSELHKRETHLKVKQRLHMLYLCKSGQATSLSGLCLQLNKSTSQVKRWIKLYKEEGLESLIVPPEHTGRKKTMSDEVMKALIAKLDIAYFSSFKEIHQWLKEEYDVQLTYHAVWHQVRHLGAKLKEPRPFDIMRDEIKVENFKKN